MFGNGLPVFVWALSMICYIIYGDLVLSIFDVKLYKTNNIIETNKDSFIVCSNEMAENYACMGHQTGGNPTTDPTSQAFEPNSYGLICIFFKCATIISFN